MSCTCYLVFKKKKAVYKSFWLSQPAKIGQKNRYFEEQIHWVTLKGVLYLFPDSFSSPRCVNHSGPCSFGSFHDPARLFSWLQV